MRVLVLCDDYWHPARVPRAGLHPLEDSGFTFDWIENAAEWSAERMATYPVVLLTKANNTTSTDQQPWMTEQVAQAFLDYVRAGHGLLVVHSGSAGYRDVPILRDLIGGVFVSHPAQCDVTITPLATSPLTRDSATFTIRDEHYVMDMSDDQADIFMTTSSEHGTQPGGWIRQEGAGRVCHLTPGHNLDVWLHPAYQTLLRNGLNWCGRDD